MRIRVGHVNQSGVEAELLFKHAGTRKLAWVTGTTQGDEHLQAAAVEMGYTAIWHEDLPLWVAVRSSLIKDESWTPNSVDQFLFGMFDAVPAGLGRIVVASGLDVPAETLADALEVDLIFYGGKSEDELGLGFFDRNGVVQKQKVAAGANDNYLEAVITI